MAQLEEQEEAAKAKAIEEDGKVTVKTLDQLDAAQAKTIQELQLYDARQRELQERLA